MVRRTAKPFVGLLTGVIFGLGLSVSKMADPEKILGFLDVFGSWDPSLLFTMGGALLVTFFGYRWVLHRGPILEQHLRLPIKTQVDRRLLTGSAIFGVGWGLAGYCPGPAVTALASGMPETAVFLVAMIAGSQVERLWLVSHMPDTGEG